MDKLFHPTFCRACDYLSILGLKSNHVSKMGPCNIVHLPEANVFNLPMPLTRWQGPGWWSQLTWPTVRNRLKHTYIISYSDVILARWCLKPQKNMTVCSTAPSGKLHFKTSCGITTGFITKYLFNFEQMNCLAKSIKFCCIVCIYYKID